MFEYAPNYSVNHRIHSSVLTIMCRNDETGDHAFDPAILTRITRAAYSR
ncbi:MAG TPA: hypothetical protein VMW73_01130 [Spirochaetia bacterium]|nr:hypothetical protein [Spirochaetia bacterium]